MNADLFFLKLPQFINGFVFLSTKIDACLFVKPRSVFSDIKNLIPINDLISQRNPFPCASVIIGASRNRYKQNGKQNYNNWTTPRRLDRNKKHLSQNISFLRGFAPDFIGSKAVFHVDALEVVELYVLSHRRF